MPDSNDLEALQPGEQVKLVMFKVVLGHSSVTDGGADTEPIEDSDSHNNRDKVCASITCAFHVVEQIFVYNESLTCPAYVISVRTFERKQ